MNGEIEKRTAVTPIIVTERYAPEVLDGEYEDDGTMPQNLAVLGEAVIGHRIVSVEKSEWTDRWGTEHGHSITLDNGKTVRLADSSDCCAYTELQSFLLHADKIKHVITGVGTTDGFTTWHVYADYGDILEMKVGWSCGNPFYYAYGFDITVQDAEVQS